MELLSVVCYLLSLLLCFGELGLHVSCDLVVSLGDVVWILNSIKINEGAQWVLW